MSKLKIFIITELFILSLIIANLNFQSRGVLSIIFLLNIITFLYIFDKKIFFSIEIKLFLFPVIVVTIYSYYNDLSFSSWQLVRSQIWLLISYLILIFSRYAFINIKFIRSENIASFISIYILTIFIIFTLDFLFNFELSPYLHSDPASDLYNDKRFINTNRNFLPLIKPIVILIPILLFHKKYFIFLILSFLTFITFTKSIYFSYLFFTISALLFFRNKSDKFNLDYKIILLYLIFIITFSYIFYTKEPQFILDRLSNLLNFSESARGIQISEVMNRFYENRFNMIFGYGLGSAYREIYILDPNINIGVYRSLINLNYDIENGHVTLLYRLGIFGCLVYVFGIFKHFKNYNLMIFIYLLIDFIGASKIGITPCLELFSLGLLVSFYQKIKDDTHKRNCDFQNND